MQLRFTNEMEGSGEGVQTEGSGENNQGGADKRPDLISTNKWFVEDCDGKGTDAFAHGLVRPIAYLVEKSRYFIQTL